MSKLILSIVVRGIVGVTALLTLAAAAVYRKKAILGRGPSRKSEALDDTGRAALEQQCWDREAREDDSVRLGGTG